MLDTLTRPTEAPETIVPDELSDERKAELAAIELSVIGNYTLADAIREGSKSTTQTAGWGNGETACALSAAYIAASKRGYL